MKTSMAHVNINICDIKKSVEFYKKALGLEIIREKESEDGSFALTYLGDGVSGFLLELTWLRDHPQKYNLGENESHIAFAVDDMNKAKQVHNEMNCVVFENPEMGIYFIVDPDGYWLEIIPEKQEE